ncbi:hypothetical protein HDU76_008796 [Blyttiomyces sp. JEL0837]|nr:hypothetical protein HDU76_008796 [Blyttiomyces sp. JEL0837]
MIRIQKGLGDSDVLSESTSIMCVYLAANDSTPFRDIPEQLNINFQGIVTVIAFSNLIDIQVCEFRKSHDSYGEAVDVMKARANQSLRSRNSDTVDGKSDINVGNIDQSRISDPAVDTTKASDGTSTAHVKKVSFSMSGGFYTSDRSPRPLDHMAYDEFQCVDDGNFGIKYHQI